MLQRIISDWHNRSLPQVKAIHFRDCLSLLRKPRRFVISLSIIAILVASAISPLLGLGLPAASAATHNGACTSTDTAKNSATYTLTYAGGQIKMVPSGFYTSSTSIRGQTAQSCVAYSDNDTQVFTHTSANSLDYTGGNSCSNSIGGGSVSDTITLSKNATNQAQTISATLKTVSGSGGKSDPCKLSSTGKTISVTVTASATGVCTSGDTYYVSPKSESLSGYSCTNGVQTYRVFTNSGDNKTYVILTGGSNGSSGCGDGYNASITLDSVPTNNTNKVGGSLQLLANQGKGNCVNSGSSKRINVDVNTMDLTGIDTAFQQIASDFAVKKCDAMSTQAGTNDSYEGCTTLQVQLFKQAFITCKATSAVVADIAKCLDATGNFTQVTDELQALETAVVSTTSCVIDGVGWIVCSMANFFATVSDGIYSLIANLLQVPIINTDTSSGTNGVYNAWMIMRNLANVAFVISFLIIIFSQLTSLGVTNYGVKKTLPRLIVAAILVNLSFWISAIAVDLSNILGAGIYDLLSGVKDNMNIGISTNWGNIIGGLLAGGTLVVAGTVLTAGVVTAIFAAGGGMAILFLAIPLVLAAVLAVLVAAFVLIARQALVVILIIISPLAFVALLLPNTEKLFSKWRSALVSMLLMYPIISIVFGGAQIAGLAIMSTAKTGDATSALLAIVVGQTVMVIPFFFIPALIMKFSGDNLKGLASTMMSKGKGLIGGISGAARKEGRARMGTALKTIKYGENAPKGRLGSAFRKYSRRFDQTQDQRGMAEATLADERQAATRARLGTDTAYATGAGAGSYAAGQQVAQRAQAAAEAEELKKALQPLIRALAGKDPADKSKILSNEVAAGGARAAAALHYSASIGDSGFMREQIAAAKTSGNEELKRQAFEAIQANSGAMLAKAPDLVKGADKAFGNVKGADLATFSKDTAKAYMEHISTITDPGNLQTAVNGFNSAVQDIANSPELQGKFGGDTGDMIVQHGIKSLPTSTLSSMSGMARIDGNGKIRP